MDINKYTNKYCNNNKAEFARTFNRMPQNVTKLFKEPDKWMVVIDKNRHLLVQIRNIHKTC